jgi:DNA sulfur modification protein DndE
LPLTTDFIMQINISTSQETEEILGRLTSKFFLPSKNILMRIALAYSLTRGRKLDLAKTEDTKGNPYKEFTVVGNYRTYYTVFSKPIQTFPNI